MWKTLLLLVSQVILCGCVDVATTGAETEPKITTRTIDTGCQWTKAIYISKTDVLTDGTAEQIREHNETGARICGWKPRAKK
ncbi:hypothetical protein PFI31113_00796 [Pandoraea fibrosis]|uniref:Lipoprotein n=1 Tax=Pandoraea fibrosis TaxID=1891094 RepID=A0A5E4SL51_9BURK|nr:hypothetical protein PFI31113_00796 [Pandoraea fibrosis]